MRVLRVVSLVVFFLVIFSFSAFARRVQTSLPIEKDVTLMALRQKALSHGFAQAIVAEAQTMLPVRLHKARQIALQEFFDERAHPYVLGYTIQSFKSRKEEVVLDMNVSVNKKNLRTQLKKLGLMSAEARVLESSVSWPQNMPEELTSQIKNLMVLTGVRSVPKADISMTLERMSQNIFKLVLEHDGKKWVAAKHDLADSWVSVWGQFFAYRQTGEQQNEAQTLSVTGWFSSDALLEFDHILKGWDSAVQDVELISLDMQPTGVAGTWALRVLSKDKLVSELRSYVPQRGLSYQLDVQGKE